MRAILGLVFLLSSSTAFAEKIIWYENETVIWEKLPEYIKNYDEECREGNQLSCSTLSLYDNVYDFDRIISSYHTQCILNEANCFLIGEMYRLGLGVKYDQEKAFNFDKKACYSKHSPSCVNGGDAFRHGYGSVVKNVPLAIKIYKLECQSDKFFGCAKLGSLYREGIHLPKDDQKALSLFKLACDNVKPLGCSELISMYRLGGDNIDHNIPKADILSDELSFFLAKECSSKKTYLARIHCEVLQFSSSSLTKRRILSKRKFFP
ncbi:tetratricopeptide repeat protein [Kiloniella antarctica]|uniref:Tetratricopeptide repeat protein n=1 Tax=Kiloniella antarctica TaxID=1550907 RepID=A0ABW5BLN3_9PROT